MSALRNNSRLTLAILGCGNMGIAILRGVVTSQHSASSQPSHDSAARPPPPPFFFTRFIACVNRPESVVALQHKVSELGPLPSTAAAIDVWQGRTLEAVQAADVILLSCQPSQASGILAGPEMARALSGKVLLSICVGLSLPQLEALIHYPDDQDQQQQQRLPRCVLVHAMPNTASTIRESSTIISHYPSQTGSSSSKTTSDDLAEHIFSSIGKVIHVPSTLMPAASVTAASTPAFFTLALQGVIDGAVAKGISREDATIMAAQAMKGTAGMVLAGESPQEVMEKVMTPKGCTERGVHVLQGAGVDGVYADATRTGIERVFEMSREREMKAAGKS
ncbi:putative pyrroline-5-carboxylate reductase [Microdochium trichocladiopsis]|uniref:Pyrroline-5-carboxylate reductase n=1 Tax=Microdochium trichocladiopsis TaxID=1682393 RepID=A0A9P9BRT0_9PEZI|nr:putative pyrroline-5-carboxylate reductase [Microdochium trichocladiopsis]KAH7027595.1 putative pyrroline-5-carboxylate reductase [Microdochium trichocladiopsis]